MYIFAANETALHHLVKSNNFGNPDKVSPVIATSDHNAIITGSFLANLKRDIDHALKSIPEITVTSGRAGENETIIITGIDKCDISKALNAVSADYYKRGLRKTADLMNEAIRAAGEIGVEKEEIRNAIDPATREALVNSLSVPEKGRPAITSARR
jgi:hypothetical protein